MPSTENKKAWADRIAGLPFQIGGGLYEVACTRSTSSGYQFVEIIRRPHAIQGVQFRTDGTACIVTEDGSFEPGSRKACLSREQALEYIRTNIKGAVLLDAKSPVTIYTLGLAGANGLHDKKLSIRQLDQLTGDPRPKSMGPDGCLFLKGRPRCYQPAPAAYALGPHGGPVRSIAGRLVWVKAQMGPDGILVPVSMHEPPEGYADPKSIPDGVCAGFDPASRLEFKSATLEEFCQALLSAYPAGTKVIGVGDNGSVFAHYCPIYNELRISEDSLQPLPEYQGSAPRLYTGSAISTDPDDYYDDCGDAYDIGDDDGE